MESARRPRLLVLATRVPLRSGDGTPAFVLDNATALSEEFDIVILAPRTKGSVPTVQLDGVVVKRFPYFFSRWERLADDAIMPQLGKRRSMWLQAVPLGLAMLWHTLKEHRTHRPDVLHANWVLPAGLVALITKCVHGTPYLVTSHGADAFRLNGRALRGLNRVILNRSARLVGVSKDILTKFGPLRVPVAVQPVSVDFRLWKQLVGTREPAPERVLFVGRLTEKKGVADAIRALATVGDVQLRIVGDGPLEAELRKLAGSGISLGQVVFLGRRTREEVAEEMRTASCLVIPSITAPDGDRDGTPCVLGEAIAARLPVVASRSAGLAEFIIHAETGLLYEPGDIDGLRACVLALKESPATARRLAELAHLAFAADLDRLQVAGRYSGWFREASRASASAHP